MRWSRYLNRALASIGALVVIILTTPLVLWWSNCLSGTWPEDRGEILIVLAGGSLEQGILGENTYGRCVYTILAYRERKYKTIVLSGTAGSGVPTSIVMRDFLVAHGVPASIIITETQSLTTRENALAVRQIVEKLKGPQVLLSSDIHMYRAFRVFQKVGIEVTPRPFPEGLKRGAGWRGRIPVFLDLVQETVKIFYYWWNGWI